jgi:glycosyltransferase involved in cell wall biosynthesis
MFIRCGSIPPREASSLLLNPKSALPGGHRLAAPQVITYIFIMPKVILVANTDWYLYNFRLSLARYLRDTGLEVVLVSPPGKFANQLKTSGFRWLAWEVGRQTLAPWKEATALLRLAGIYRRERPDVVHHFTVKPVLYGTLSARLLGIPGTINSITGLGYIFLGQETKARYLRELVKQLYRLAFHHPNCAAIFENDTDRQYFISEGLISPDHTWLIEGVGIDSERFIPTPEPVGVPLVVLPARMLWDKGVGTLVEAAPLLHTRLPVRIALVGEPDPGNPATIDETILKSWEQEGTIEWWGWQQDMQAVYTQCHIVALPSLGEGVPTVLLEAASCGKPIVTTDAPGCRDVVTDGLNGLLVPPNDPPALAEALYRLLSDAELRDRMGKAGRHLVLDKFTNARVNPATFEVYRTILSYEISNYSV